MMRECKEKERNDGFEGNAIAILGFTASTDLNVRVWNWVLCICRGSNGRIWQ